jgi:hypothetical protein
VIKVASKASKTRLSGIAAQRKLVPVAIRLEAVEQTICLRLPYATSDAIRVRRYGVAKEIIMHDAFTTRS